MFSYSLSYTEITERDAKHKELQESLQSQAHSSVLYEHVHIGCTHCHRHIDYQNEIDSIKEQLKTLTDELESKQQQLDEYILKGIEHQDTETDKDKELSLASLFDEDTVAHLYTINKQHV